MAQDNIPKNQIKSRNTIEQREHEDNAAARRVTPVDEDGDFFGTPSNPIYVIANDNPASSDPTITNISAPLANTEYSFVIPDHTSALLVCVRDRTAILQVAFVPGDSALNFLTVGMGNNFSVSGVDLIGKTLYFQVNKPGKIIEILAWS